MMKKMGLNKIQGSKKDMERLRRWRYEEIYKPHTALWRAKLQKLPKGMVCVWCGKEQTVVNYAGYYSWHDGYKWRYVLVLERRWWDEKGGHSKYLWRPYNKKSRGRKSKIVTEVAKEWHEWNMESKIYRRQQHYN